MRAPVGSASEMCSKPSLLTPTSTNAPKSWILLTTPSTAAPAVSVVMSGRVDRGRGVAVVRRVEAAEAVEAPLPRERWKARPSSEAEVDAVEHADGVGERARGGIGRLRRPAVCHWSSSAVVFFVVRLLLVVVVW